MNYYLKDTVTNTYFAGYNEKGFSQWSEDIKNAVSMSDRQCWSFIIIQRRVGRICEMISA